MVAEGNRKFKAAVLAVQANIRFSNRFRNVVEDPSNPYSNHSETESSSEEEEEVVEEELPPSIQIVGPDGRPSIVPSIRSKKKKPTRFRRYRGMILALLSSFIFSVGALVAKLLNDFHPFSLAFWRFQGTFIPVIPLVAHNIFVLGKSDKVLFGIWPLTKLKNMGLFSLVLLRSFLSSNSLLLHFYSLKYIGLGDALTIASSTPILVALFARIFLGEKCGVTTVVASVFTMVGVLAMTRPPMLTGEKSFDADTLMGSALGLACMILAAISYTVLRYIRKVHYSITTLMFGTWGVFENLILALLFHVFRTPSTLSEWGLVLFLCVLSFFGQFAIILAMKAEQAGPVALVRTFDVLFGFGLQMIFLGILPDWLSIVGSTIVVLAVAVCGFRKWLRGLPIGHPTRSRFRYLMM